MTPRREVALAVGACVGGAALALLSVGRPWANAVAGGWPATPGPAVQVQPSGGSLAPAVAGLALVGLAGGVALAVTKGLARMMTAVLVLVAGAGIVVAVGSLRWSLADAVRPAVAEALGRTGLAASEVSATGWPWVALLGGLLAGAGGGLALVRGRRWPGMSARYDAPAAGAPGEHWWHAQDRGEDPTASR